MTPGARSGLLPPTGPRTPHPGFVVPAIAAALLAFAPAAQALPFNVTTTADQNDAGACTLGDPSCSLREAVIAANTAPSDDVINLPAGTYRLTRAGTTADDTGVNGDLDVLSNGKLTITGAGARITNIDGNLTDRVFDVRQQATLNVSGVSISRGSPKGSLFGGGLQINGNGASPPATVTLTDSAIVGNQADQGAGFNASRNSDVTLVRSTVSGNRATQAGGGISSFAVCGGCTADLKLGNSTVSGNAQTSAQDSIPFPAGGGGIATNGAVTLDHATIASNSAMVHGGGIQLVGGTVTSENSIVSGNTAGAAASERNCDSPVTTSNGFNLELGTTCGFTQSTDVNGDPKLLALGDYGGPTNTMFPGAGSAALDTAASSGCPAKDQRGVTRPKGLGCDIGAVEAEPADVSISIVDSPDPVQNNDPITYTISVHNGGSAPAQAVTVRDVLPSALRAGSSGASQGSCTNTQTEVCTLGSLPAGDTATVTILAFPRRVGTVSNTATVSIANVEANLANNSATTTTRVKLRSGPCANEQVGTAGPDTLIGTPKGDRLKGQGGDDKLFGRGGADCLFGGKGNDRLKGGKGKDKFFGGKGNDVISAADGQRDEVDCGKGHHDKAVVDSHDVVKNCEVVIVR